MLQSQWPLVCAEHDNPISFTYTTSPQLWAPTWCLAHTQPNDYVYGPSPHTPTQGHTQVDQLPKYLPVVWVTALSTRYPAKIYTGAQPSPVQRLTWPVTRGWLSTVPCTPPQLAWSHLPYTLNIPINGHTQALCPWRCALRDPLHPKPGIYWAGLHIPNNIKDNNILSNRPVTLALCDSNLHY